MRPLVAVVVWSRDRLECCVNAMDVARRVSAAALGWVAFVSAVAFGQDIRWIDNYPDALAEAKVSGKPILLTFRCVP